MVTRGRNQTSCLHSSNKKNPSLSDHIVMSETLEDEKSIVGVDFDDDGDNDDPLYEDAKRAVIDAGKASTSYLQRRLKVGYSRAARLIDLLEERGVVGGADGAKPREILDTPSRGISTEYVRIPCRRRILGV
jgi:DNA segregation ATPase FtsK/SpoIIIE-like protein